MWLKADFGVTVSGASNVTNWSDASGNRNDVLQPNSSFRPNLITNAVNGLPSIRFTAANSNSLQITNAIDDFSSGSTVFVVTKPTTMTILDTMVSFGTSLTNNDYAYQFCLGNSSGAFLLRNANSGGAFPVGPVQTPNGAMATGVYGLVEAADTGLGKVSLFSNGGLLAQGLSGVITPSISWTVGFIGRPPMPANFYDGEIAEVMIYNRLLSGGEMAAVETYLQGRYVIGYSVPAPTISVAGGTLSGPAQVAISSVDGATIHFTVDGTSPSSSSPTYSQPVNIAYSQTLKAIAIKGGTTSSVSSAAYTLDSSLWPAPSATDPTTLNINLQLPAGAIPQ